MNKERYNQIIDEAYKNFLMTSKKGVSKEILEKFIKHTPNIHKVEFIDKIKTNKEFSEKWGLKIEERELSLEERKEIMVKNKLDEVTINMFFNKTLDKPKQDMYENSIPTKLITVTHNNETVEIYE